MKNYKSLLYHQGWLDLVEELKVKISEIESEILASDSKLTFEEIQLYKNKREVYKEVIELPRTLLSSQRVEEINSD